MLTKKVFAYPRRHSANSKNVCNVMNYFPSTLSEYNHSEAELVDYSLGVA